MKFNKEIGAKRDFYGNENITNKRAKGIVGGSL